MASPLLINIAELLRHAGTIRNVDRQVEAVDFDFSDDRIVAGSKVDVGLTLEALTDSIVVHGTLQADWRGECRRCLRPLAGRSIVEVQELYQKVISDPDAYQITGEQLDLLAMIRENVLLSVPIAPLCRVDCPGLCSKCGVDLQSASCSCAGEVGDERWAVLDALKTNENQ